jgi:hypothetical protein
MEHPPTIADRLMQRSGPNRDALTGSATGGTTFTGGWVRQVDRDPYGDRPSQVFTAGKEHYRPEVTEAQKVTYQAPPGLALDVGSEFTDGQYISLVTEGGPVDLSQNFDRNARWEQQAQGVSRPNAAHWDDQGASRRANYAVPGNKDHTERTVVELREGIGTYAPDPVALQRGLNALDTNNPEGYRKGFDPAVFVHRRIYAGGGDDIRHHSYRVLSPNTPYFGAVGPYVPTPTGTPYPTNARFVYGWQRVQPRREPPPMDDNVIANPDPNSYPDVWSGY